MLYSLKNTNNTSENMEIEIKKVDKYTVEVANSALDSIVIPSSMDSQFDFHVDDTNGKVIITTKVVTAE